MLPPCLSDRLAEVQMGVAVMPPSFSDTPCLSDRLAEVVQVGVVMVLSLLGDRLSLTAPCN